MNLIRRTPTALSGYRPRAIEDQFGRLVESMFEDMFAPFAQGGPLSQLGSEGISSPRLNVRETDNTFEVEAELPGIRKEDVNVAIDQQRVTIEAQEQQEDSQKQGENLVYAERSMRRFSRSFSLPSDVDESAAQARLENGILHLSLPKKQGSSATRLAIQ
jgi:HSP20 family protein